jgi:hypothetical protein
MYSLECLGLIGGETISSCRFWFFQLNGDFQSRDVTLRSLYQTRFEYSAPTNAYIKSSFPILRLRLEIKNTGIPLNAELH